MRKLKLLDSQIRKLIKLPESGMGYHMVKLFFRNGTVLSNIKVLNSQFLLVEKSISLKAEDIERVELEAS